MTDQTIKALKALSNQTRLEIVKDFLKGHETVCPEVKEQLSKSQPTLSHHLTKLVDANILIETKKGVNCFYAVNSPFLQEMGIDINKMAGGIKNG